MNILALKLLLAPLIIGSASLAPAFIAAILATLVIQGLSFLVLKNYQLSSGGHYDKHI